MKSNTAQFFQKLLHIKTRHFFTWSGSKKTYRLIFTNGDIHKNITKEMLFNAAKKLNAPSHLLSGVVKRAHFRMYELSTINLSPVK